VERMIQAKAVVGGQAEGVLIRSEFPISLWGGLDPSSGRVIDRRHDRCGDMVAGHIFAFPEEKGSSTASAVLVELIRNGHAPSAIITCKTAPIVALGAIIADELYGRTITILVVDSDGFDALVDGTALRVSEDGTIEQIDGTVSDTH